METCNDLEKAIEFCTFPFLGTTVEADPFQYLIYSVHNDYIEIAICEWLVNRMKLTVGETVELHIPPILREKFQMGQKLPGTVLSSQASEKLKGELYRISLSDETVDLTLNLSSPLSLIQNLKTPQSHVVILIALIKDSLIIKQGVEVYLKHLIPYFSRIVDYTHKEYVKLEHFFFRDVLQRVQSNIAKLESLHQNLIDNLKCMEDIPVQVDLESIRAIIESEISVTLFDIMFGGRKTININNASTRETNFGFYMYINSIKTLEKRICLNYNKMVVIYLNSLQMKI